MSDRKALDEKEAKEDGYSGPHVSVSRTKVLTADLLSPFLSGKGKFFPLREREKGNGKGKGTLSLSLKGKENGKAFP